MNMTQAIAKLRKLLGPKAGIQDDTRPSSPEHRALASAAFTVAKERFDHADEALNARRKAVLDADPEYQRLRAEYQSALQDKRTIAGSHYYRYTAGTSSSLFFHVKAQADTLAELIEEVERTAKEAA